MRFWGPLYPGSQQVEFAYGLALDTDRLELALPGGARRLDVLAPEGLIGVASESLSPAPPVEIEGQRYTVQRREGARPGEVLDLALTLAERAPSPIRTPRAELWLELDDAALEVNERIEVIVDAPQGVPSRWASPCCACRSRRAPSSCASPARCCRPGCAEIRRGDLAIHGPLAPGATQLALRYRTPASAAAPASPGATTGSSRSCPCSSPTTG